MPNHHLILILGKGQTVLNPEFGKKYRKAIYSTDNFKTGYITPFVGDAIINQPASKYSHVHILGTKNSMWDTLYDEIAGESLNDEILEKAERLASVINEGVTSPEDLHEVSKLYGETHGVKVFSYIIPVSENDDDSMAIFNKIMELNEIEEQDTISIDITHGLRYQPLFLLTGFEYFSKLKKVKMGDIFYGALELSNFNVDQAALPTAQGKINLSEIQLNTRGSGIPKKDSISLAEIQNFKIINKMFEAINAANLFVKFGKTDLLLQLEPLKKRENLSRKLLEFDYRIQLASLDNIKSKSKELLDSIAEELNTANSQIDRLLLESISQLPTRINKQSNELLASLDMCSFYIESGMFNNAALATFDVMLRYVSDVFNKNLGNKDSQNFIKNFLLAGIKESPDFSNISKTMLKLSKIRNSFAHTTITVKDTINSVNEIKEAFKVIRSAIQQDIFKDYSNRHNIGKKQSNQKKIKEQKGDPKIRAALANYKLDSEAFTETPPTQNDELFSEIPKPTE